MTIRNLDREPENSESLSGISIQNAEAATEGVL